MSYRGSAALTRQFGMGRRALKALCVACGVAALVLSAACSDTTTVVKSAPAADAAPENTQPSVTTLFSKSITKVTIEVDYAAGAEPYFGTGSQWSVFNANTLVVFDGKKKVVYPKSLDQMEKIDAPAKTFTRDDILAIAAAHRSEPQYSDAVAFYVVFLNGTFTDETGTEQPQQLSVSLGQTGVIAVFKPAVSTPVVNPTPAPQLIEQIALIHAFGHAVGFVDDGVPVGASNRAHVDTEHPHHCTNIQCVLHHTIETAAGAAAYAKNARSLSADTVLYGQECLSDARILESTQLSQ